MVLYVKKIGKLYFRDLCYNKLHTFNAVNEENTRNDRQVKICYKLPSIHKLQVLSQKSSLFFFLFKIDLLVQK